MKNINIDRSVAEEVTSILTLMKEVKMRYGYASNPVVTLEWRPILTNNPPIPPGDPSPVAVETNRL